MSSGTKAKTLNCKIPHVWNRPAKGGYIPYNIPREVSKSTARPAEYKQATKEYMGRWIYNPDEIPELRKLLELSRRQWLGWAALTVYYKTI